MDNILEYEKLVYSIIHKYKHFDQDDLYQAGMLGLINAYKNFNSDYNIKFSTYAYCYIIGEVTKYIREAKSIKVSKDLIKLNKSIDKAKEVMRQKLKREPTITELSLFLEVDEAKIEEAYIANENIKSLDYSYDDEQDDLYNSIKTEEKNITPRILDLKNEIMNLSSEERDIIIARYYEELTQSETSKELGISQVQVSRKETKILQKLRTRL